MGDDPIYRAAFKAGVEASAALLEGRASMAREMQRSLDAHALDKARAALVNLARTLSQPPAPPTPTQTGEGQ